MVQFLSINFFSWISSICVGFFKISRFLCHPVQAVAPKLLSLSVKGDKQKKNGENILKKVYQIFTFSEKLCCVDRQIVTNPHALVP